MTAAAPVRLVVLLQDLEFGGTQRYAIQLLKALRRDRFAPELWVLRGGDDLLAEARACGAPLVHLSRGRRVGPVALARLAWALVRRRPHLLYTLTAVPNIWGRVFAGLLRIPVVSGYRNLHPRQHERLLHRFSTRIIANAAALEHVLVSRFGVPPDRVAVIPNAVDADHFTPDIAARSPDPLIVCAARQEKQKDIPTLLAAFDRVRAAIPGARLEIVGGGSLRFEAPPNAVIRQGTNDVRDVLRRGWLFALSSAEDEGMPNAVLEAMACGLPVVATGVGGVPECVIDGETGLLVPPRDPRALGEAIIALLRDRDRADRMGQSARRRAVAGHAVDGIVRRTEDVLLAAARGAPRKNRAQAMPSEGS